MRKKACREIVKKIDYEKAMKQMGIDVAKLPKYENAETFGRGFKKVSLLKKRQISYTSYLSE